MVWSLAGLLLTFYHSSEGFLAVLFVLFLGILWKNRLRETIGGKGLGFCFLSFTVDTLQRKTGKKGMKVTQDLAESQHTGVLQGLNIKSFVHFRYPCFILCRTRCTSPYLQRPLMQAGSAKFHGFFISPDEHFRISSVILVTGISQCISK